MSAAAAGTPVRVVVDGRYWVDPIAASRGMGRYVRHVVDALGEDPRIEVVALTKTAATLPAGVRGQRITRIGLGRFAYAEHVARLARDIRRARGDVYWCQSNEIPRRSAAALVQTVHDLIPLQWPDEGYAVERDRWRRSAARARLAEVVIAVSHNAAREAVALLGIDAGRVRVIHHGVDDRFREARWVPSTDVPYVLVVAGFGFNKGYAEAFEAVAALADLGLPHRLRVVGTVSAEGRPHVDALLAAARRPDRIDLLGEVNDVELLAEYAGASALLVTSRHEGFGLPAAEAMAVGLPVVGFHNTSIPEVVGDAGHLVADGDVAALVTAAAAVLTDAAEAAALSEAGRQRARMFDWRKSGEHHAAAFVDAARGAACA